jgi:uncharacterized protein involved in response to NO
MVCGFLGAFVAGFLATAAPRLSGTRRWSAAESAGLLGVWLVMVWCHGRGVVRAGDLAFAVWVVVLLGGLGWRVLRRCDVPPPGFVLVGVALAGAGVAALVLAEGWHGSPAGWRLARLGLFQGFVLLPLMGIGPYLLPRFFGEPSLHAFAESVAPPPGWWPRAGAAGLFGAGVIATFVIEAFDWPLAGQLARAALVLGWFARETPLFRRTRLATTPGNAVRWAVGSCVVGLAAAGVWPLARVGSLHLLFASGFGLAALAVGTRVVLGHAGRHDLLGGRLRWLRWVIGLAILAAATRMTSDFIPQVRVSHHVYAAWCWVALAVVWLAALARFLGRDEPEPPNGSGLGG